MYIQKKQIHTNRERERERERDFLLYPTGWVPKFLPNSLSPLRMTAARSDSSRISIALAGLQAFFLSEKMGL
jgi:hypothetical protein